MAGLYWAASKGYINIVQMMVDHGAAVDLSRHVVIILLLIISGCDLGCGYIIMSLPC